MKIWYWRVSLNGKTIAEGHADFLGDAISAAQLAAPAGRDGVEVHIERKGDK